MVSKKEYTAKIKKYKNCIVCGKSLIDPPSKLHKYCSIECNKINLKKRKKKCYQKNKVKLMICNKKWREKLRIDALRIVGKGKIECAKCGIKKIEILEINHKNGIGRKKDKKIKNLVFYGNIVKGKRNTKNMNILCRVCNAAEYIHRKFGIEYTISPRDQYMG